MSKKKDNIYISDAFQISSFIIKIHNDEKQELDLLRLLKVLYFCFGYISARQTYNSANDKPEKKKYLFNERIEAWALGPVIPDIYYYVRLYCDKNYKITEVESNKVNSTQDRPTDKELSGIYEGVKEICESFFKIKSSDLVYITHKKGSPWDDYYDGTHSKEIPKDHIIKYFDDRIHGRK